MTFEFFPALCYHVVATHITGDVRSDETNGTGDDRRSRSTGVPDRLGKQPDQ